MGCEGNSSTAVRGKQGCTVLARTRCNRLGGAELLGWFLLKAPAILVQHCCCATG